MFGHQFPTYLPIAFFVILLVTAAIVGRWLVKNDKNYKGIIKK
ncbi:hypothetical protein [Lacihabitans lacunae]|jgi:hypothetical protein|uniref:Uncharacterized protein n=1 Tax=Lacihabitans lacunae TaxID=1028214 RepID=A0ABV7YV54_9BACT